MTHSRRIILTRGDREYEVEVLEDGRVRVEGRTFTVLPSRDGVALGGEGATARTWSTADRTTRTVFVDGRVFEFEVRTPGGRRRGRHHHGTLSAPMPATVRRIAVRAGDAVTRGQVLIVLEAMKMELPIRAAADGTIETVNCREGDLVQPGSPLIEMDEVEA